MSLKKSFYLLLLSAALCPGIVHAQKKEEAQYRKNSELMRNEVWGWKKPQFSNREVPAEYSTASKVVLARHQEIIAGGKKLSGKVQYHYFRDYNILEITREVVRINDKAALDAYSEISFQRLERYLSASMGRVSTSYVGVKVFKANGTVKEINADDIVLTKNESTDKQAKLAIPDLQVGDVVDYFIATDITTTPDNYAVPSYSFYFVDDDPVLHRSVHIEINKKYLAEYRAYQGAPVFKVSEDDKMLYLDVEKKNMPPLKEKDLWVSPHRQFPLLRLNIVMWRKNLNVPYQNIRKSGMVYANQDANEFVEDELIAIASIRKSQMQLRSYPNLNAFDRASYNYASKLEKSAKKISADSMAAEIYYLWRYQVLSQTIQYYLAKGDFETLTNCLAEPFAVNEFAFKLGSFYRREFHINNRMVLTTSRYGPEMKSVMSAGDYGYLIMLNDEKPLYMSAQNFFTPAFYVPSYYENIKGALAVDMGSIDNYNPKYYDKKEVNLPGSSAAQNLHIEEMTLAPDLSKNELKVKRRTTLTGHYKAEDQKKLVLLEEYYESERKRYGKENTLLEEYQEYSKRSKKFAEEIDAAFIAARKKQKEAFESEAKEWFEQEVKGMTGYKVEQYGNRHNDPAFIYRSEFGLEGMIKKAGNNYIVDIGKMQGTPIKIEPGQRDRSLDIYAPFARLIEYKIVFEVPEGYDVEGVDKLAKQVENETGFFTVKSEVKGNKVNIFVRKAYKNNYEPASNWGKMLEFLDASQEWTNAKLLLRKK